MCLNFSVTWFREKTIKYEENIEEQEKKNLREKMNLRVKSKVSPLKYPEVVSSKLLFLSAKHVILCLKIKSPLTKKNVQIIVCIIVSPTIFESEIGICTRYYKLHFCMVSTRCLKRNCFFMITIKNITPRRS